MHYSIVVPYICYNSNLFQYALNSMIAKFMSMATVRGFNIGTKMGSISEDVVIEADFNATNASKLKIEKAMNSLKSKQAEEGKHYYVFDKFVYHAFEYFDFNSNKQPITSNEAKERNINSSFTEIKNIYHNTFDSSHEDSIQEIRQLIRENRIKTTDSMSGDEMYISALQAYNIIFNVYEYIKGTYLGKVDNTKWVGRIGVVYDEVELEITKIGYIPAHQNYVHVDAKTLEGDSIHYWTNKVPYKVGDIIHADIKIASFDRFNGSKTTKVKIKKMYPSKVSG